MGVIKSDKPSRPFADWPMSNVTVRDYFAAKAMQGLLSSPRPPLVDGKECVTNTGVAMLAYIVADAMLRAREVKA